MKRIAHTQERPNIAGVSLALYLLVALLSMMAAYEVSRSSDDIRNSVIVSLQSAQSPANKSTDDGRDSSFVILALEFDLVFEPAAFNGRPDSGFQLPSVQRSFNARAPPGGGARLV